MRRFFVDPQTITGDEVVLCAEESHHIVKVLRLPVGERVELLDGRGTVYRAVIAATGRQVVLRLEGIAQAAPQPEKTLWVGQGILKGEKMDTVVQKCTELGVDRFTPFHSARCQGKLDAVQAGRKRDRWRRIVLEACKQCLRPTVPQLDEPVRCDAMLQAMSGAAPGALRLLCWEEEKELHLGDLPELGEARSVVLLLGPEGGFTREEVELARDAGFRTVSLGGRILRAETATLAAVAVTQFLAGRM